MPVLEWHVQVVEVPGMLWLCLVLSCHQTIKSARKCSILIKLLELISLIQRGVSRANHDIFSVEGRLVSNHKTQTEDQALERFGQHMEGNGFAKIHGIMD